MTNKNTLEELIKSSVWKPVSSKDEPTTELTEWQVFKVPLAGMEPTTHFVGKARWEGRVSSPIVSMSNDKTAGISQSGRRYVLVGLRGSNSDAIWTFGRWLSINQVEPKDVKDVTDTWLLV
jgi:hypothetical protein